MENPLAITLLNDYIFCPLSIYFHQLYLDKVDLVYKDIPQIAGTHAHESIENFQYSHKKSVLCGYNVYSDKYNLYGKIDIFNIENGELIERKKKIKVVYDGYIFQLYAQYFCLKDMGYNVYQLKLISKDDNKIYLIDLPEQNTEMLEKFETLIKNIRNFNILDFQPLNELKCKNCIYRNICDRCLYDE